MARKHDPHAIFVRGHQRHFARAAMEQSHRRQLLSFAVIMHDTDAAPAKGTMDVTHWIFWNIPASSSSLAGAVKPDSSPDGIMQGKNVRGVNGYQPPLPASGRCATPLHFEIYALDSKLDLAAGSPRADLLKAMDGHVIGKATYFGLFGR